MCRNIKVLFNFDPPATDEEIEMASLQYVRKLSGFQKPSSENKKAFYEAVEKISKDTKDLLISLKTKAHSHDREIEKQKRAIGNQKRFAGKTA